MSRPAAKPDHELLLGALLRLASQATTERFTRWIASAGFEGVQPAHSAAIQPLWEVPEGARITTLARASCITKQSMSVLVSELESGGYVERVADPDDARAVRVCLTDRGRAYARAVRKFARSVEAEWAAHVGVQRIEDLRTTLALLRSTVFLAEE
jgi:DNA-binding MarR family transcriptional regulator